MGGVSGADAQKRAAAEAAVALVENGMTLGLGSGSTMTFAVEFLGRRVREEGFGSWRRYLAAHGRAGARPGDSPYGLRLRHGAGPRDRRRGRGGGGHASTDQGPWRRVAAREDRGRGGAPFHRGGRRQQGGPAARRARTVPVEVMRFGHEMTARRLSGLAGRPVLRLGADQNSVCHRQRQRHL